MDESEIFELLEKADWNEIGHKLILFAVNLAKKYNWKSGNALILPGGRTPEDIAYEAIEKILNGTRNWNPDKHPNLLKHLQYIVKSDISHLLESNLHQKTFRMPDTEIEQIKNSEISCITSNPKNPEKALIEKEYKFFEDQLKENLYNAVAGDNDLETILLLIDDGIWKPKEIAREMGKEVSEINTLKRKLVRKGKKIFNLLNSSN